MGGILAFGLYMAAVIPVYAGVPTVVSAKITGPNTVVIYYSEPVTTSLSDYTNFSGNLAGNPLSAISGSGTATITLTFGGNPFQANASGSLSIQPTTVSVSDRSPYGGSATVQVTDGQSPALQSLTITSNNAGNTFARAGNVLTISFTANEIINTPTVTIAGQSVSVGGVGSGPYSSTYTITQNDVQNSSIPITVSFTDTAGNGSRTSLSVATDNSGGSATITSNATTSGALKVGDSITFTLIPASPAPNASISGSYNGTPLSWSTGNNGSTYTATYTVTSGSPSQTAPLQISNVVITYAGGNTSPALSGNDIVKTIDTTLPVITEITPVPSVVNTAMPIYTFNSSKEGTIQYTGDCGSPVLSAAVGSNTVIFNKLADGLHNNCTVTVTDLAGNVSNTLHLSAFTVSTSGTISAPAISASPSQTSISGVEATGYKFTVPLERGSSGNAVTQLQLRLTKEGVYSGPITGYFGPLTEAAVKSYQTAHGLQPLGNVGPGTRAALNGQ